jgi:hypothetical protein
MKDLLMDFLARFSSRKFLLAVFGALVVFGIPMSEGQIAAITALIIAFTAAEGVADAVSRNNEVVITDATSSEE